MTPRCSNTDTHRSVRRHWLAAIGISAALCSATVQAAIPDPERQALIDLYQLTRGFQWTHSDGWNGAPGTECAWYGVTCNAAGTHVVQISVAGNRLAGTLPASLQRLARLVNLDASLDSLTGEIPPLAGFAYLRRFDVGGYGSNRLTGTIPLLPSSLEVFVASYNSLSGEIPPLAGLPQLGYFEVSGNPLSGSIPPLDGLWNLLEFAAPDNQLTGQIPPLAGLARLGDFDVNTNRLPGSIPVPGERLAYFDISHNELAGAIPPLAGHWALTEFFADHNQLSGRIPPLPGLHSSTRSTSATTC